MSSNSAAGQVHRERTDRLLPDGTSVGSKPSQQLRKKRERDEPDHEEANDDAAEFDEVEFALRLAEEVMK